MYDLIIIGGGAVGTSIARRFSKYNIKSILLEKNSEICQETTKANSAIIHGGYDAKPGSLKARLNVRGSEMYPDLAKELNFTYKQIGSLVLGFNDEDRKVIEDLYTRGKENKVKNLEIIGGEKVREMEPFASEEVTCALYCPTAGIIDPFNYSYANMENAMENGVELRTKTEVSGLEKKENFILVKTNNGDYKGKFVINAAGLFSDRLANMAGDYDFKIIPTKGVYRLLFKNKYQELNKVLFQTPSKRGKGVLVTPTYAGNTMLGPTAEKIDGNLTPTEEESLEVIDSLSKRSVPTINVKNTIRVFTGIRAKPDTGDFMIYPSRNMEGVVHVGGIESPGLSSAPAIAEYVDDILAGLGFTREENKAYNPIRKAIPRIKDLGEEERAEKIKENPLYEKIICRCENVTEGEIVDAIRRPGGAVTRDGVKRRVRAGMGFCQGNHCGPKVREILSRELGIDQEDLEKELKGTDIIDKYFK